MSAMHPSTTVGALASAPLGWPLAAPQRLVARRAGWLHVGQAQVWLTQDGQAQDWVLAPGERLWLAAGSRLVAEVWQAGAPAQLCWAPQVQPVRRLGLGGAWLGVVLRAAARGLAAGAAALSAAARSAEASARRAQGAMPSGDSIASSGARQ